MNLPHNFIDIIIQSKKEYDLLTASPEANGFHKAGRVKKWIPYFYRAYELALMKKVKRRNAEERIRVFEYNNGKWTFHAKGAWFYNRKDQAPEMTIIGSSNYSKYW